MARHLLSARRVTALLSGGRARRHGDGGCLYLQVNGPGRGAWVFMSKRGGKQRPIGLGSVRDVPLKDARELAEACRRAVIQGHDPRSVLAEASGEPASAGAANAYGTLPKLAVIAPAKTRSAGAGISTSCYRSGRD